MMQSRNKVIIAAAGSGKTTYIVDQAISKLEQRILIVTYTNENLEEIRKCIITKLGFVPSNIKLQSWFSFLLQECARPYQNFLYDKKRIESIKFIEGRSASYISKSNTERYYFNDGSLIYTDKIAQFVCECNEKSKGLIIHRLEKIFDHIFIDEVQDLAGYDLDIVQLLFGSIISTDLVGDNRQTTYKTNNAAKYSKFNGEKILDFFIGLEKSKQCNIEYRTECHRSIQVICNFADLLYPHMPKTVSTNDCRTGHDGLFIVKSSSLQRYIKRFNPVVLRHDKKTQINAEFVMNFGQSKGQTYNRVLIIPTTPMKKYLMTGKEVLKEDSRSKFYVAVTRAKYSVAIMMNEETTFEGISTYEYN
ncbi:UvrD-helicase domain-containing protein [Paenibacillus periandrae]|uniref:UvrD-helicase domain-containing protein n=1 Tax=Paenibacillus periandrae TaxID=1761741 RepID=UPI001F08CE49|nr:UvrD-helicase domain-containing protein [Paenibacillus periandrae]